MEILSICGGFLGVLVLTNQSFFTDADTKERHKADQKKYHYYYLGIVMAFLYTVFSALNFYEMRQMGHGLHSSIKTFYFGAMCSLGTLAYIMVVEHDQWFTKKAFPLNWQQFTGSMIVGFFSWANQESLSLSLTVVKQGTASAFNNMSLIISLAVDTLYFHRRVFTHDLVGAGMIIVFAVTQCLLANAAAQKEEQFNQQATR